MSTVQVEVKEESEKSIKTREYLEENKDLAVRAKWFTNPVSLNDYKIDYLRYISKRRGGKQNSGKGSVRSHVSRVINGFTSVDCITIHAIADLIECSDALTNSMLKNIDELEWLEVTGGTDKVPVFSKIQVNNAVQLERKLYNQSCSILQASIIMNMPVATLRSYLFSPDRSPAYSDLQPLISMHISKTRRVSRQRIAAHIAHKKSPLKVEVLTISDEWFINPVSLPEYKVRYFKYITNREGAPKKSIQSRLTDAIERFNSLDCITSHAIQDLTGFSQSRLSLILSNIEGHEWLDVVGEANKVVFYSREKVIKAVKLELEIEETFHTIEQAASILGVNQNTFFAHIRDANPKYNDLLPLVRLPIKRKGGRISKIKLNAHIASRSN